MDTPKASTMRWRGAVVDDMQLPAAFALPSTESVKLASHYIGELLKHYCQAEP